MTSTGTDRAISAVVIAVLATLLLALGQETAGASPLILPGPSLKPGKAGWLEVVAPRRATSCSLSFRGGQRSYGPYRVPLGGPTRLVRWKVPKSARGSWKAAFSCHAGRGSRAASLGRYVREVVIRKAEATDG
jgi:hypothetical protein